MASIAVGFPKLGLSFLALAWVMSLAACGPQTAYRPPSEPGAPAPAASGAQVLEENLTVPSAPHDVVHEVGPMETLWRLAKMYGVSVDDIARTNHISNNAVIKIGQKLTIPNARSFRNMVYLYPGSQWRYIIVHHTASDIGSATLVHRAHHDRGFWNGIGYHFLIDNGSLGKGDGQIEMSPRWVKQQDGAHCRAGGMNHQGIGIALVGNFSIEQPPPNQLQSLATLIKTLSRHYQIPSNRIMGHRDVAGANTECPGTHFPWAKLRRSLTAP